LHETALAAQSTKLSRITPNVTNVISPSLQSELKDILKGKIIDAATIFLNFD